LTQVWEQFVEKRYPGLFIEKKCLPEGLLYKNRSLTNVFGTKHYLWQKHMEKLFTDMKVQTDKSASRYTSRRAHEASYF